MTCIVALQDQGLVWMAGDSAAVEQSHYLRSTAQPKVFVNGDYLIGYTTSFRMGQLLQYSFEPPTPNITDIDKFMATTFATAVRVLLKDNGWLKTDNGRETGGNFLVGVQGKLYEIDEDFNVLRMTQSYSAVGSGISVALGAMWATEGSNMLPAARLITALEAAQAFTTGVRGPFTVVLQGEDRG